ncbi:hypothetical protein DK842_13520 [Chromobacterium phragmitis]|nr:hypothetical protein DK842_13520 [Chromobacterium phragmitis]
MRRYCRVFRPYFAERRVKYGFFRCAGSLNYGHNDDDMIEAAIAYMREDGILNGLDLNACRAKAA